MQNLYYNITGEQELAWDCPEGRPSAITSVTVYASSTGDDGTTEAATTGSAAVETNPNTTFDGASGAGESNPQLLNLAATTGMSPGRCYLATNALGEQELVEITAVTSGVSAEARHELRNAYANADTLVSTRISISVDDTWIADSNKISDDRDPNPGYRIRWVYVVDSITRVHDAYFNVVRYRADHDVAPTDVAAVRTGWIDNLPVEYADDRGESLIDEAYAEVVIDLHAACVPAEMMRNRSIVNRLTIRKAIMMASENRAAENPAQSFEEYLMDKGIYDALLSKLVLAGKTQQSTDESGAAVTVGAVEIWSR